MIQVRSKLGDLDGIVTFCELAVPLAARLSERLGIPGNSPEAVDTARNKHAARACMERAGLPTPRNALIKTEADLAEAAEHVGFPAVIKPISGAASIGVIRVNDRQQLETSFKRCAAAEHATSCARAIHSCTAQMGYMSPVPFLCQQLRRPCIYALVAFRHATFGRMATRCDIKRVAAAMLIPTLHAARPDCNSIVSHGILKHELLHLLTTVKGSVASPLAHTAATVIGLSWLHSDSWLDSVAA